MTVLVNIVTFTVLVVLVPDLAGTVACSFVSDILITVASVPLKDTFTFDVSVPKCVPLISTKVPFGPVAGLMEAMVGSFTIGEITDGGSTGATLFLQEFIDTKTRQQPMKDIRIFIFRF